MLLKGIEAGFHNEAESGRIESTTSLSVVNAAQCNARLQHCASTPVAEQAFFEHGVKTPLLEPSCHDTRFLCSHIFWERQ
ncbi:hypothetical protein AC244_27545 [Ensifer adhaerens]|uniref:Uncharacterized protein n=1 Tax=Ensifer adhaerens TaxID=106592 RepID=A0A0L8BIK7_ENSAD|nr:hypothetical protein AC244_27545 [Ensifer adhaerens]